MPSITAYTPFETLKFCQSIAQHGADTASFEVIATLLNANELIRESETYDQERLSASALHSLYNELLARERDESPEVNGELPDGTTNPRKRKASTSPSPSNGDIVEPEEDLINSLVEKLYARFREEAVKEIRKEEEGYQQLQNDIKALEAQAENAAPEGTQPEPVRPKQHKRQPSRTDVSALISPHDETPAYSKQGQEERLHDLNGSRPSSTGDGRPQTVPSIPPPSIPSQQSPAPTSSRPSAEPSHQPQTPSLSQSPAAFHRTLPPPSPQRPGFGHPPPPHAYMPGPHGQPVPVLPPPPGMQHHMPPPMDQYSAQKRSSTSTPARGSPAPPPQQPYAAYTPYQQQPPPWPQQYQHAYTQHMQYPTQPYYVQPPGGRPPYAPSHQGSYSPYPQPPPGHYPPPPQGWHPSPQHAPYSQSPSAATTPLAQAAHRRSMMRSSGSSTPWKKTPLKPGQARPASPSRPEREVSPLSDTEMPDSKQVRPTSARQTAVEESTIKRPTRRGRPPSATPSGIPASRSQSIASYKSETPTERPATRRTQKIKDETPSTPLASSDADQPRSARRGRTRNATVTATSTPQRDVELSRPTTVQKRKRSPPPAAAKGTSATPELPSPSAPHTVKATAPRNNSIYKHDPSLVLVSKNFAKTSQLVLNEITSNKLAGIFAKPLSERDAPGYKDLVLRPTDLKNIRAAVTRGSRAAVAAIVALEVDGEGGAMETPTKRTKREDTNEDIGGEGAVGGGKYLVKKTEELVPPKGIVNSSQLEMELTRMFANAVMFNPLPTAERGFGRNLRVRRYGGDISVKKEEAEDGGGKESTSGSEDESSSSSGSEGGGIIADAREMFEDVVSAVGRWREVEVERITGGSGSGADGGLARQGSVSMSVSSALQPSHDEDEGGTVMGTPVAGGGETETIGTSRKRRRMNDG